MNDNNIITLYPSNWLYNAGVIGLLSIFQKMDIDLNSSFNNDGSIEVDFNNFMFANKAIHTEENFLFNIPDVGYYWLMESYLNIFEKGEEKTDLEKIIKIWGTLFNVYYRGFFNPDTRYLFRPSKTSKTSIEKFALFLNSFGNDSDNDTQCAFCYRKKTASSYKNHFTSEHFKSLGASSGQKGVPNSFWNLNADQGLPICDFCSFIILNHHLSFTKLADYTEIFINAPSYKLMFELNKVIKETYGTQLRAEAKNKREILAVSVIEYSRKLQSSLGQWTGMNIEVIRKGRDKIDCFSLPYDVVKIISDRGIAAILSEIGEFKILNKVLDKKYSDLVDIGYKLLKESAKDYDKRNQKLIDDLLYRWDNKRNLTQTANKILTLYLLIEERNKRS